MGKEAVDWMLEFLRATTPGFSLIPVAIAFAATFLAARLFYALCEHVVLRRPLPWSGPLLSLLIAVVLWSPLFSVAVRQLETLAAYLNGQTDAASPIHLSFYDAFLFVTGIITFLFFSNLLLSPFSLLIVPFLLFYLVYPNGVRERATRMMFIYVVVTSMVGNYLWKIAFGNHSS